MVNQIRCFKCNKLLFTGEVLEVQIKCPRCKALITIKKNNDVIKSLQQTNIVKHGLLKGE